MRKFLKILPIAAALLPIAAAIVFGGGWIVAWRERGIPVSVPVAAALAPEVASAPGAPVLAAVELRLPWGNAVTEAEAKAGDNTVISGPVRIASAWHWGYRIYRIEATVRPLATTGIAPGRLLLTLERGVPGAADGHLEVAIPEVRVKDAAEDTAASPAFAAPEKPGERGGNWWKYVILAVVLLGLLGYFVWWHLRVRRTEITPWDLALLELTELGADMKKSGFQPEEGVVRLSDILRRYFTERFGLPAVTEAGTGFLDAGAIRELAPEDREFLRSFFAAAELIKFARTPAETPELERAVASAESLIGRTIPPPEPRGGKAGKTEVKP